MSAVPRTQTGRFRLEATPAAAIRLFTAQGERTWVPGWEPKVLSGSEERGSAFETRNPGGETTTWIVIDYRPSEGCVSYARLAHGSNIGLVDVACVEAAGGGTEVSVAYTLTPFNRAAEDFVREFLDPRRYARMLEEWRAATTAALAALER